ncbi:MAG: MarC family NAAT transporter [Ignavibacteriales bacterium]|nr:MarC family NAAT transporter [Ignavibacteriales bacterium]
MKNIGQFLSWVGVALITLVPIINPVSTAFLLLGISAHLTPKERNRQITWACIYMTGILVTFLLLGHFVMIAFGISIPGIRIAGGLVISFLGFRMLFPDEGKITREEKKEALQKSNISFSPLAMPSLSGPGAIAAVITMSSSIDGRHGMDRVFAYTGIILAILITAILSWLVLRGAGFLRRILGVNGIDNLSRIMGFLLICIGAQFAIDGVRDLVLDADFWTK